MSLDDMAIHRLLRSAASAHRRSSPGAPLPGCRSRSCRRGRRGLAAAAASLVLAGCASFGPPPARDSGPLAESVIAADPAARQILVTIRQDPALPLQQAGSTPRPYRGRIRYGASPRARRIAARLARQYQLRAVDEWPIAALDVHCVVYEIPEESSARDVLTAMAGDPRVESVQPMQLFEVQGRRTSTPIGYNDPYLHLQHGVDSMQVLAAHRWSVGRGITVAVLDTGVDSDHPELAGRISVAKDFVGDRRRRPAGELHGTAVAGVIASRPNNGLGIVGVAPDVRILALKACWEVAGEGTARCSSFTLAKAIAFALEQGPDVVNLGLSGPRDPLLERLIGIALDRGMVVVAAAGEPPHGSARFPTSIDGVIAVCSAGSLEEKGDAGGGFAALSAPGREILTTTPGRSFDFLSGSSFAAAHVTGIAALALQLRPGLDASTLRWILALTSTELPPPGEASGVTVNACAAIAHLVPEADCSSDPTGG